MTYEEDFDFRAVPEPPNGLNPLSILGSPLLELNFTLRAKFSWPILKS